MNCGFEGGRVPEQMVIIDTDPATGYAFKDVDDGLAILYLLARRDEFDVLGLTAVHGNASLKRAKAKAHEIVGLVGRTDVPVLRGAGSRRELGADTPASTFLNEAVRSRPGEVTVLALGPLTNVATAGIANPDFYDRVARIVVMGGVLEKGLGIPLVSPFEFNFFKDPEAADAVLAAPCEKVLITADLCQQALFTRRELDSLWQMQSRAATYLAYRIEPWLKLNQVAPFLRWKGGFVPWDVVAAVYLRRPDLFGEVEERGLGLKKGRLTTGALESRADRDSLPVKLPMRLEPDPLLDEFLEAISLFGRAGQAIT